MKRDVPEGNAADRSASVKSTRISDAAAEMLSPVAAPIGEFAALAATPHGTPAASLAPTGAVQEGSPPTVPPKRSRAGARSVPPSLAPTIDSPSRRTAPGQGVSPNPAAPAASDADIRRAVEELTKAQAQDRARIGRLEAELDIGRKQSVEYTDRSIRELRGELSEFSERVDQLMQTTIQSVASLADLDDRFKSHLSTAFAAIEREFGVVKTAIDSRVHATLPPGVEVHRVDSPDFKVINFEEKIAIMERLNGLEGQVGKLSGLVPCTDGSCHCPCVKHLLSESVDAKRQMLEVRSKLAAAPQMTNNDALLARITALEQTGYGGPQMREPPTKSPFMGPNGEGAFYPVRNPPGRNGGDGGFPGRTPGQAPGGNGGGGGFPGCAPGQAHGTTQFVRDPELKFDRMFEDKVALNSLYSYTGKEGEKWTKTTCGYWLSGFPGIQHILEWAEAQEGKEITDAVIPSAVHVEGMFIHMTYLDMQELSRAMWGFLNHCVSGPARSGRMA